MDQKKIGLFLKELRKEKGITQEAFAEMLNISGRTVSRWETGNNLPDISLLVSIADFYEVDVREIIEGERKSEMNEEIKDVANKMADYAGNDIVNIGLHFFHKDVRPMPPLVKKHSTVVS